jgi:hypothetical protein
MPYGRPSSVSKRDRTRGQRRRGREPDRADGIGDLRGRVGHVLLRAERRAQLEHAVAVGLVTETRREQAARLGPVAGELAVGGDANTDPRPQLALDAARQPDEWSDGRVRAVLAEQGALQLRVAAVERLVVPVEAAARLRDAHEEIDEHRAEQRVVLGWLAARVRARVDRGGALAMELLERDRRVVAATEAARASLDEVAHERPVLVQRRAVASAVLLERERQRLARVVELAKEVGKGAERERAEGVVELRRANGHALQLGAVGGILSLSCARRASASASRTTVRPLRSSTIPRLSASRSTRLTVARDVPARAAMSSWMSGIAIGGASPKTWASSSTLRATRVSAPTVYASTSRSDSAATRSASSRTSTSSTDACCRARRRSSEPRTTRVSPASRAVTVALRSPAVITASSPNVSPGPRIPRATVSPSGVPMRTSKRPLTTRCTESAGS